MLSIQVGDYMVYIRYSEIDLAKLIKIIVSRAINVGFMQEDGSVVYSTATANKEIAMNAGCKTSDIAYRAIKSVNASDAEQRLQYEVPVWDLQSKSLIPSLYFKCKILALNISNFDDVQNIGLDEIYSEDSIYVFDGKDRNGEKYDKESFESLCSSNGYLCSCAGIQRGNSEQEMSEVCKCRNLLKVSGIDIRFLKMTKTGWAKVDNR